MRNRAIGITFSLTLLTVLVLLISQAPLPDLSEIRAWSQRLGPWFPIAFVLFYAVVTTVPIPRSTFTYSSAVLFAPSIAIPLCLIGTAAGAALSFSVVRRLGYARTANLRAHPRLNRLDQHVSRRGWTSVLCLRLVPAVPFSILNYASALSSIPPRQFLFATVVGSAPGTVAAILLGNSLTTGSGSGALWATAFLGTLGLVGLLIDSRLPTAGSVRRSDEVH